jgi:hypothetical protein
VCESVCVVCGRWKPRRFYLLSDMLLWLNDEDEFRGQFMLCETHVLQALWFATLSSDNTRIRAASRPSLAARCSVTRPPLQSLSRVPAAQKCWPPTPPPPPPRLRSARAPSWFTSCARRPQVPESLKSLQASHVSPVRVMYACMSPVCLYVCMSVAGGCRRYARRAVD